MKIKKLLKIFGLLILAGNIVNAEYIKRNGEIYYREWMEQKPKLLKNIDYSCLSHKNRPNKQTSPNQLFHQFFSYQNKHCSYL